MALVALLFAHHGAPGGEPLAAIDVAGLTVLERQVVLSRRLGAEKIFVIAERMPPGLAAALDRVGDSVKILRDPALLGEAVADDDLVLSLQEGLVAEVAPATALLGEAPAPLLAVTEGEPAYQAAERLDSLSFWAGFAVYPAEQVKEVAADIGEWDLQSTLLRTAASSDSPRLTLHVEPAEWRFVGEAASATALSDQLLSETRPRRFGWPSRFLFAGLEPRLVRLMLPTRLTGRMVTAGAVTLGLLGVLLFAFGWPGPALLLAILSPQLADAGVQLARLRLEPTEKWIEPAFDHAIEPGWYLALGAHLSTLGWSAAWPLAIGVVAARVAMNQQSRFYRRLKDDDLEAAEPGWSAVAAGRDTLPWLLLPFALLVMWKAGLIAIAIYAASSFFVLQARLFSRLADPAGAKL
ncbi:hypothetical protein ACFOMD_15095 [Sphingoaurantiacus capsulatus]|uniref:Glycosyl transferase n=1 Tax=Sphingoaurantiacus capsulatus TaxID=1771310 RepID=A0ABV7XDA7_9SPHN